MFLQSFFHRLEKGFAAGAKYTAGLGKELFAE